MTTTDCQIWLCDSYEELVRYARDFPMVKVLRLPNDRFVQLATGLAADLHAKVVKRDDGGTYIDVGRLTVRPK